MSPQEHQRRVEQLAQALRGRELDAIYVPAANKLIGSIKRRIQRDGKSSSDNPIGSYSSKPAYYSKSRFVQKGAFKPSGKKGPRQGAKTMYIPGGYKGLRAAQGRPTDKVNLTYSGDLMASFKMVQGEHKIVIGLDSQKEAKKKEGLEKRYGKFLYGTRKELLAYNNETKQGLTKLTTDILKGIRNV
ncbi:MAG: hypothetical protein EOP52_13440 [Sphingobacteriales bacterium]|nr:MAG: hypothetical protein EOP52_13440 [Sphingobacteriales bacterium]